MRRSAMRVDLALSAVDDLGDITGFYDRQGVPEVGRGLLDEIFQKIERLKRHPDSGRVVPEFGMAALREIVSPPFRIVYRREPTRVWVVRVWRGERLMKDPPSSVEG